MKPFTLDVLNFVQDKTEEKYLAWLNLVNKLRTHARECGLPELDKLIGSVTKSLAGTTHATFVINKHPHFGNVYNDFKNKELKDFSNRLKTKKEIEEVSKWIHDLNHSGFFEELNKTAYAFIREFLRNRNKFKVEGERNLLLIINEAIRFGVTDMRAIVENSYCEG